MTNVLRTEIQSPNTWSINVNWACLLFYKIELLIIMAYFGTALMLTLCYPTLKTP